jgi:hypothetical protein
MNHDVQTIMLTEDNRRLIGFRAADCAERVLPLFDPPVCTDCRTKAQLNLLTVSAQSSKTSCGSRSGNVRPTTVSKSFSSGKRSDNAVLS